MPPHLIPQLDRLGRTILRWRAQLSLTWGAAAILGMTFLLGLIDLWLRLDRANRVATWLLLLALLAATLWLVRRTLQRRFTPEAVAATVERTFPQLDNRLINYLQLARSPEKDPFKLAYLRGGAPDWEHLDFRKLRDEKAHRQSRMFLLIAAGILIVPVLVFGQAWAVAVWRTVNPFSTVEPPSLTKIVSVQPGNSAVLQGQPLTLACTVRGFDGHEVRLEIEPTDAPRTVYRLGRIAGAAEQPFSFTLAKVGAGLRYRFQAGDAPNSAWYTIATRPPPAFTALDLTVTPPAYMRRPVQTIKARTGRLVIPTGAQVRIQARANTALASVTLRAEGLDAVAFAAAGGPESWSGTAAIAAGSVLRLKAEDTFGNAVEEEVPFALDPDKPPGVEIVTPTSKAILPPGERAQIHFRAADDYGLAEVILEQIQPETPKETRGTPIVTWRSQGQVMLEQVWKSEAEPVRGQDVIYRLVARDNRPAPANETVSMPIQFSAPTAADLARQRRELEAAALATLQRVLEMQKRNLSDTDRLRAALREATEAQWRELAARQKDIRTAVKELLANPIKPLGAMTEAGQKLYANEMVLAADALGAIPGAEGPRQESLAREAYTLETTILRQLTSALAAMADAKVDRRVAGLSAMLEALVRGQKGALTQTRAVLTNRAKVSKPLVDAQDRLGDDMGALVAACKDEGEAAAQTDPALAATLGKLQAAAAEQKIRDRLVVAAERLDQNKPADAVPLQEGALTSLQGLLALLEQMKLKDEAEKHDLLLETVKGAREKLAKIEALHQEMRQAMETVKGQKNKDTEATDAMEEAYQEMLKNTKEALLEVPTDLHIFTELNVANDLVQDVSAIFQEIEQTAGSEKDDPSKVADLGFAKEDELLAMMGEASKKVDAMEMWLGNKPDENKVTTEAHDKAEMPQSGVALAELASSVQDLIGDLLKEDKKMADQANDGATNHAMSQDPPGWEVMEGDISSFGANGKSGNQTPDHKEQDGRSNVGRQGMSNGETAAGSGTIGEGDKNIEARRTEDPMQSGQVDLAGQADTKATGGGKLGTGKADGMGMGGGAERKDSKEAGSQEGMAALMARQADAVFAKASMKNIRVDSLKDAAHQLRQSADAIAKGNIEGMREFRKMAVTSLNRAEAQLQAGPSGAMEAKGSAGTLDNVIQSAPDQAPPQYRDKVAEYYKALNSAF